MTKEQKQFELIELIKISGIYESIEKLTTNLAIYQGSPAAATNRYKISIRILEINQEISCLHGHLEDLIND